LWVIDTRRSFVVEVVEKLRRLRCEAKAFYKHLQFVEQGLDERTGSEGLLVQSCPLKLGEFGINEDKFRTNER
jgi:hypothetical protein